MTEEVEDHNEENQQLENPVEDSQPQNDPEAILPQEPTEENKGEEESRKELQESQGEFRAMEEIQEPIPERIKDLRETLLKILKTTKGSNGRDLYNHLKKIFVHIALTDPATALDKFEEISYELRTKNNIEVPERFLNYCALSLASQSWVTSLRERYFDTRKAEGETGEPAEPAALGHLPDLLADNRILECAGLGFGEELSYLLMKSLKDLAVKQGPRTVHFWGLIHGSKKDYFVAEGEKEGGEAMPEAEARGTGVNRYVYWVTDSITGEWVELPDALPSTINLSRRLKQIFTGDVDAEVVTNPPFGKKEKELLRAQIARIAQMTSIIPKGYFKKQEENERDIIEVPEEEKKLPTFEQLTHLENWCHFSPNILKTGRTAHQQPEPPKEEPPGYDPAVALKELELQDPYEPRLKPLSADTTVGDWKTAWTLKVIGDPHVYKEEYKEDTFTNAIIMLKSYVWPGAYIFYQNNRWFNFYLGYGFKADQKSCYPIVPPIPRSAPLEKPEYPEPNPREGLETGAVGHSLTPQEALARIVEILADPEKFNAFLNKIFDTIDVDQSGQIERNEVDTLLKGISRSLGIQEDPDARAIAEFFKLFDRDKDGKISKEELMEPLRGLLNLWAEIIKESLEGQPIQEEPIE